MLQKFLAGLLCLSMIVMVPQVQAAPAAKTAEVSTPGPRKYLANIVFAGLAGAILGLSTLSFYGRPQDKLSNIAVGFAIGVIGGTMYTTFKAATEPKDFYSGHKDGTDLWAYQPQNQRDAWSVTPRTSLTFQF